MENKKNFQLNLGSFMASSCVRFPKVQLRSPSDNFPSLDTFKEITINSYRFIKKEMF